MRRTLPLAALVTAFGLAACEGVMQWCAADGRGFVTAAARVPIVVGMRSSMKNRAPEKIATNSACDPAFAAEGAAA